MTASPEFASATVADLAAVRELLAAAGLPFEDLDAAAMENFLLLRNGDGGLHAIGAVEPRGEHGLLRSVVVTETGRGAGLGKRITTALEARARTRGMRALYLLTTTAAEYFPRLGYEKHARDAVPPAIAASAEFAALCPASTVCFRKNLE